MRHTTDIDGQNFEVLQVIPETPFVRVAKTLSQLGLASLILILAMACLGAMFGELPFLFMKMGAAAFLGSNLMLLGLGSLCLSILTILVPLRVWVATKPLKLSLQPNQLTLSGLTGPFSYSEHRLELRGLNVQCSSLPMKRFSKKTDPQTVESRLSFVTAQGETVTLWPMVCSADETEQLLTVIQSAIDDANASNAAATVPQSLQDLLPHHGHLQRTPTK